MRAPAIIIAAIASIASLASIAPGPASAEPFQCKDVAKGDIDACNAQVKSRCTQKAYWDRRTCEDAIAIASDRCLDGSYAAACKKAWPLHATCADRELNDGFAGRYNAVGSAAAEYGTFDKEWAACYRSGVDSCPASSHAASECKDAPGAFRDQFTSEVDAAGDRSRFSEARELLASTDELDRASATLIASNARTRARALLDVNADLRAELRYKEAELRQVIAEADKLDEADKQQEAKAVQGRSCPKGKSATGVFMKLIKQAWKTTKVRKLGAVPITGDAARTVDRATQITTESIPAWVCFEETEDGKHTCGAQSISFYREKAPGSPWSSWSIAWGGDAAVSCKKRK